MKKFICSLLVASLMFMTSLTATSAVGTITSEEQKIIDVLEAGVEVDGSKITPKDADLNAAKNYLTNNDVTASQVSAILSQIEAAKAYMKANHIKDTSMITGAHASALLEYVRAAASVLGLTVTVNADGTVSILDANGQLIYSTTKVIKRTGYDLTQTAVMAGGLVAVLLAVVVYAKRKQLFA